ncbi:hypothetical protein Tco_1499885 [Tanacetum coccineum]
MVAYLEKSPGSAGFHQIIDFINRSHICYALSKKPEVCVSFIKQFWRTAEIATNEDGNVKIHATIDGHSLSITEGSIRRHLKLDDKDGLISLPSSEIFAHLHLMGRLLTQIICPKKTAWEQFSSNIAAAIICLATNRRYAETQVPTTLKMAADHHPHLIKTHPTSPTPSSSPTHEPSPLNHHRPHPLLHNNHHHPWVGVLEADLSKTKKIYSSAYTKLTLRVKKLESQIKVGTAKKTIPGLFFSDTEVVAMYSSKQGGSFFLMKSFSDEISTAVRRRDTASEEVPQFSTAEVTKLVLLEELPTYTRKGARKEKIRVKVNDRRRAQEGNPRGELEQERLSYAEALRLKCR